MKHRRGTSAKEAKQVLRLLVLSDSHGDAGSVYRAVAAQPEAAAVLYPGGRQPPTLRPRPPHSLALPFIR